VASTIVVAEVLLPPLVNVAALARTTTIAKNPAIASRNLR
jgi:hypothetical protein